ncbi:MAG: MFS transporter, partial [Verrucomicrobiaceae bacterium]
MNTPVLSERKLLLLLAAVQFTHIMDFMIMMPLGPQLMRELGINAQQFGALISSFAITSGIDGLAVAPFADRFDRRKLLLFCYAGFVLGTLACGLCETGTSLFWARAVCGAFGGVSGATIMAIVADVVPPERRAQGMGIIMTAFSAAAALGVPFGLKIAQWWKWEGPFLVIAGLAALVWVGLFRILPPVRGHLSGDKIRSGRDFLELLRNGNAWIGLGLMVAMIFGHFTIIPYLSPYLVGNVKLPEASLFLIYLTGGLVTIFTGPLIGKLADKHGRFLVYSCLIAGACIVIRLLTSTGPLPVWQTLVLAAFFFTFASGRFVPGQAVISMAVPSSRRGAY